MRDHSAASVKTSGIRNPDLLMTDTVGFIQKLPTNLIAAFRYIFLRVYSFPNKLRVYRDGYIS